MVACRYRWLAAFLPFIDIKKAKSIISDFMPTDFPNEKTNTRCTIFKAPATNQLGLLFYNCVV